MAMGRVPETTSIMAEPPELWTFAIANLVTFVLGLLMTGLSFLAYRANDRAASFRNATIGFGLLTLGMAVEPTYQLGWKTNAAVSGRELLGLQTLEAVLLGLGLGLLFYSIYEHESTARR